MDSFATALELAETDDEKYDTLSQIITIGSESEGMPCCVFDKNLTCKMNVCDSRQGFYFYL